LAEVCGGDGAWCHPERISWQICTPVFLRVLQLMLSHLSSFTAAPSAIDRMQVDPVAGAARFANAGPAAMLAGTGRRVAIVASSTSSGENSHVQQECHCEQGEPVLDGDTSSCAATRQQHAPDLRDSLAKIVHILLESLVMLSAQGALTCRSAVSSSPKGPGAGGSHSTSLSRSSAGSAQDANIISSMLQLILMIIKNAHGSFMGHHCCFDIVRCIFQPVHAAKPGTRGNPAEIPVGQDPVAQTIKVEALIRQFLISDADQTVRGQTQETLFQAIVLGWNLQILSQESNPSLVSCPPARCFVGCSFASFLYCCAADFCLGVSVSDLLWCGSLKALFCLDAEGALG
jgi:hypothetical protein